mmetsp:Transcript_6295/g.9563  ORF Transcript_6295/g.9563 Transcript_6295/m.9563 type:complete len:370 (-) Transcript_6295:238-1347(-)
MPLGVGGRLWAAEAVGEVVGGRPLVVHGHGPVALVVGHLAIEGLVDGDLLVVGPQAVAVGVSVRKQTGLQHLVWGRLNARHHVGRGKGGLLHFRKVVLGIAVQHHAPNLQQGVVLVGPNLGDIKWVEAGFLGLLEGHNLNINSPRGVVTIGNGIVQIADGVISILTSNTVSFTGRQVSDTLIRLEVILHIERLSSSIHVLEGVAAVPIHVAVAIGGTSVAHQERDLVSGFRTKGDEVPEHVGVLAVGLGVALLGVDERREEHWVPDEENGGVVADHVPVALLGVELDGEPAGVAGGVGAAGLSPHSGEPDTHRGAFAHLIQELGLAVLAAGGGGCLKKSKCPCSLGMDHSFRNSFTIKVGNVVQEHEVL